jgi:hypothetical protein
MEVTRQVKDKDSSVAKLAQQMYYQLLDEHNELLRKSKKETKPKIKIKLSLY